MGSNKIHRPVDEIQWDYTVASNRAKEITILITQYEAKLLELQNEHTVLKGTKWGHKNGTVTELHTELKYARLRHDDQDGCLVIWQNIPNRTPRYDDWIVDKVTPKRIFTRRMGETQTTQYKRDGIPIGACFADAFIDVEATLKNFKGKIATCK
jgi:hypothetical protein